MEENNNEKISVSGADLLKDVVADEKAAKTAPKDTEKDKKDKDKKKDKKEKKTKDGKKFNAKKLKHGTMATVFTCVFVALLVLVNVVTTMLFDRYPITIDLTTNKIYSVSNDTEDYVKKVNVDVQVTIFADENTYTNYSSYNKQAVELLKNYCKLNHHITYRFVDIDSHPEIVKEYTDTISQFDMIFETKTDFWLASRYVNCDSGRSYAYFGLHSVSDSYLYGTDLFFSYGNNRSSNNNRLAPVVSLGSGVQIKSGEGTTEKPYVIGK